MNFHLVQINFNIHLGNATIQKKNFACKYSLIMK